MVLAMKPPQPPPIHRLPLTCERHPDEVFNGFCASCLSERLQTLDSAFASASATHRNSTSTISASLLNPAAAFNPELRRCKSFSCHVSRRGTGGGGGREIETAAADRVNGEIEDDGDDLKPMKVHLESQAKKPPPKDLKEIAGGLWLKLQKWRKNQKLKKTMKKNEEDENVDRKSCRRSVETQSEVAVDAFGRRSCDVDPRLLFDCARYSLDEARASWDGCLIGGRSVSSRPPPLLSVVEDAATTPVVRRIDGEIQVEEDLAVPGGSEQTKDYYFDSSSKSRRRSLDRSNSVKRSDFEVKPVYNAKVSPSSNTEFFRDWNSNVLGHDQSESIGSAFKEYSSRKKSKGWSIWGFLHRRGNSSNRGDNGNVVETSFLNGNDDTNERILRRNSSVRSRSSINGNAWFGKKGKDEPILERNQSARFSLSHNDSGKLRFYLTPTSGSRKGLGKGKHSNGYSSFASGLQLY